MRNRHGGSSVLTSGVADVKSHAPARRDSRFRRRITVRQLLQHTSGVPDYLAYLTPSEILEDPLAHHDIRDLVNIALAHPPTFKPGTGWRYSNTGYLLAGMLIEKVTDRTYGEEIRRRIVAPLGLRETCVPRDAPSIPGPHPRGYVRPGEDAPLMDITAINPSVAGPSGSMISSGTDLNRFLAALLAASCCVQPNYGRRCTPAQPATRTAGHTASAWKAGPCPAAASPGDTPATYSATRRSAAPRSGADRRRSWRTSTRAARTHRTTT